MDPLFPTYRQVSLRPFKFTLLQHKINPIRFGWVQKHSKATPNVSKISFRSTSTVLRTASVNRRIFPRPKNVPPARFSYGLSNPRLLQHKIKPHPIGWGLILWRSRRDLNPRYPFGVHTISSRDRYDHFGTAPCVRLSCRLAYNTRCTRICQALIYIFCELFFKYTLINTNILVTPL